MLKERQRLTLPGIIPVPSALVGLTALFGMGRGDPHRYSHLKVLKDLANYLNYQRTFQYFLTIIGKRVEVCKVSNVSKHIVIVSLFAPTISL